MSVYDSVMTCRNSSAFISLVTEKTVGRYLVCTVGLHKYYPTTSVFFNKSEERRFSDCKPLDRCRVHKADEWGR